MSDLISRSALIKELELYEKELRSDREVAIETDDEQMLFAITNQETAICRIRRNVLHMPIAYDKEAVVEQLEEYMEEAKQFKVAGMVSDMIEVVKAGGIDG